MRLPISMWSGCMPRRCRFSMAWASLMAPSARPGGSALPIRCLVGPWRYGSCVRSTGRILPQGGSGEFTDVDDQVWWAGHVDRLAGVGGYVRLRDRPCPVLPVGGGDPWSDGDFPDPGFRPRSRTPRRVFRHRRQCPRSKCRCPGGRPHNGGLRYRPGSVLPGRACHAGADGYLRGQDAAPGAVSRVRRRGCRTETSVTSYPATPPTTAAVRPGLPTSTCSPTS